MSKSPVTFATLAAFAAAVTIGILSQDGAAQEANSSLRRLPVQLAPGVVQPVKPAQPMQLRSKRNAGPTGPAVIGAPGVQLANLVVVPYYNNASGLPEGFPTHSYCMKKPTGGTPDHIRFYIRNIGNTATGGFQWTPSFPNAGAAPAHTLPSIPAGGQVTMTLPIPNGCYTPGFNGVCQFSIHLDDHNEVQESNEANTYSSFCVSPAG